MKITSLLSYFTALTLTVLIAQIVTGQPAAIAGTAFCTAFFALFMIRDYTPRNRYVVTSAPSQKVRQISQFQDQEAAPSRESLVFSA